MENAIKDFAKQFLWKPEIVNASSIWPFKQAVVGGMGGSHLAADLFPALGGVVAISVHRNYGLPAHFDPSVTLFIASSYSGNTEETLDFARTAFEKKLNLAVIAKGGKLIEFARANNLPHIILPDTGIQPRSALGFSVLAFAKMLGDENLSKQLSMLGSRLDPLSFVESGKKLAKKLSGYVPVIYASEKNLAIAYNWKIKFNETGKIPAFSNSFPELNHNEMTGYDWTPRSHPLSEKFAFVFLSDDSDHPQIRKRFEVAKKLFENRGFAVQVIPLTGANLSEKIFSSLIIADWAAYYTAFANGAESEQVPMIEEFKKMIG